MMKRKTNNKGFTLIELMIVVVIIGILAALAIPRFMAASTRAKQGHAKLILKQVYTNQRTYRQQPEYNSYYQPAGVASSANPNVLADIYVEIMPNCMYTFSMVADGTSFTCTATANLDDDATVDTWTIDDQGQLINTVNDVTT